MVAEIDERARDVDGAGLVGVLDADEDASTVRELDARRKLALDERFAERLADTHHFAGRLHFRPEDRIDARKLDERKHRFFYGKVGRHDFAGDALRLERSADHAARRDLGERTSGGLGNVRNRARRARIHFEHVDARATFVELDRELNVHQSDHVQPVRHRDRLPAHLVLQILRKRERR